MPGYSIGPPGFAAAEMLAIKLAKPMPKSHKLQSFRVFMVQQNFAC
jgi:hypothetical protein